LLPGRNATELDHSEFSSSSFACEKGRAHCLIR